jgi:hypothetical protein
MSETDISRAIRESLTAAGVWCFRVQSGKILTRRGGAIVLCPPGTPDNWTEFGWLETKDPNRERRKTLTDTEKAQLAWRLKAAQHGVNVAVVESMQEAFRVVAEWKARRKVP